MSAATQWPRLAEMTPEQINAWADAEIAARSADYAELGTQSPEAVLVAIERMLERQAQIGASAIRVAYLVTDAHFRRHAGKVGCAA